MWDYVKRAARWAVTAINSPARARIEPPITSRGHVPIIGRKSKRPGKSTTKADLIESRAMRKAGNTPAAIVRNYRTVHQTLAKGRFSDAKAN